MKKTLTIMGSMLGAIVVLVGAIIAFGGFLPTITEIRMDKLRIGMTDDETEELLGRPTTVITNDDLAVWHYDTMRRHAEPYVVFTKDLKVKAFGQTD